MGPRKWLKVLRSFMKDKEVSPEDLAKIATEAGINISLDWIKEKLEKLDEISDEEDKKQYQGYDGCVRGLGGPGKWRKLMKAFCAANNIQPEDVQKEAAAKGFNLAENYFEKKLSDRSHSKNFADKKERTPKEKKERTPKEKKEKSPSDKKSGKYMAKRAQCYTDTTEKVYEFAPGQTIETEVEIRNATHWALKEESYLGMDDLIEGEQVDRMPVE